MTPVLLLAIVFGALIALGLVGLYAFGTGPGSRSLHIKASLWPPSFEFHIKQRSN
jgi:hypothetical protein